MERAKAFEVVAQYLDEDERSRVAKAIAQTIAPEDKRKGDAASPSEPTLDLPAVEDPVVAFLEGYGFCGAGLVRATGLMVSLIKQESAKHSLPIGTGREVLDMLFGRNQLAFEAIAR